MKVTDPLAHFGPWGMSFDSRIGPLFFLSCSYGGGTDLVAFANGYDVVSNKIKISAARITANLKRLTINYWDRNLGSMETVVHDIVGAGEGNRAYLWSIDQPAPGDGKGIIEFSTADHDIPYGNPPERP
jgi:hypothetical protein